jgi:hypothetical protein
MMPIKYGSNALCPHKVEYSNAEISDRIVLAASNQGYSFKNVSPGETWIEGDGEEFLGVYDSQELARKAAIAIIIKEMKIHNAVSSPREERPFEKRRS